MKTIHIHQGGTLHAYCGARLTHRGFVSWEDALVATCPVCIAPFSKKA